MDMFFKHRLKFGMMMNIRYIKHIAIYILSVFLLSSCYISPEIEEKIELEPQPKYLGCPEDFKVYSDYENHEIALSWSGVEGATHYEVEYESAVDYLSGKEMKKYITLTPSFSLSSFSSSSDKRYIFRVRAGKNREEGILFSQYTDLLEGAMVDDYSISYVIRDGSLYFYSSSTKASSILHEGEEIVEREIVVYEGEKQLESGKRKVEPGETITLVSKLMVDGKAIKEKENTISVETSMIPRGLKSISASQNRKGRIDVSFASPGINMGLENTEILFLVERKDVGGKQWEELKNGEEKYYSLPSEINPYSEFNFTITDDTATSGKDYIYRVRTIYRILEGEDYIYTEESDPLESNNGYIADESVSGFHLSSMGEPILLDNGSYSITVKLLWETYHFLPSSYSLVIERKNLGEERNLDRTIEDISSSVNSFTDTIILTKEEKRDPKTFIYNIRFKDQEGNIYSPIPLKDEKGNDEIVEVEGDEMVEILENLNASSNLNGKIKLSWTSKEDYSEHEAFDKNKVSFSIYRSKGDGYSLLKSDIPFGESVYYDVVPDDSSFSYMVKAFYNEEDVNNPDYIYVRNYPYSNAMGGKTLDRVLDLSASYNLYNDRVSLSWTPVEGAESYIIKVKIGEEEKEYVTENNGFFDLDDPSFYGKELNITIEVEDEEKVRGSESEMTKGRILSSIVPQITNGDKFIRIQWDGYYNVDKYILSVYSSENATESVDSVQYKGNDALEYTLSSLALEGKNLPDNPLSTTYWFSITPYNGDSSPKEEKRYEGSWVLAPQDVSATKALYRDKIDVSWDSVPGATGYVVESRLKGEEEWKRNTVFAGECFSHYDPEGEYEYRVATLIDGNEGPFSYISDSSTGYALSSSKYAEGKDEGNSIYSITFSPVKGADSYMVKIPYWENSKIEIKPEKVASPVNKSSGFVDGDLTYNDGYYTYYFAKRDLTHSVSLYMDLYSVNSEIESSENYSKPKEVRIVSSKLNEREVVNLTLYTLRGIIERIDSAFEGDWWARTGSLSGGEKARTYTSDDSKIDAKSSYGEYLWDGRQNLGYINISDYSSDNITIINGNLVPRAENGGEAGYLGTDPFHSIDSGSLIIAFPYGLGVYSVEFNGFKNDLSSGSATVTKDGISKVVNAIDTKIVMLQ